MAYDLQGARAAGVSDSDIADHLAQKYGYRIGDAREAGVSDADIISHLMSKETTPQNDNGGSTIQQTPSVPEEEIDRSTGAGWKQRFAIGSANDMKDKLTRARAFYGDSVRQEGDNISFINPETGKRTLINPEGLDWGDVAGFGREIASGIASIPAFLGGTAASGVGGLAAGAAAGAGTGLVVDQFAEQLARDAAAERGAKFGQGVSAGQMLKDAALETVLGTVGGKAMDLAGKGVKYAFNPMKQSIVQAYKDLGLKIPSVASATGGKLSAMYENTLSNLIGGNSVNKAREQGALELQKGLDETARRITGGGLVPANTTEELGLYAQEAQGRARDAFSDEMKQGYDEIANASRQTPASLSNTRGGIKTSSDELSIDPANPSDSTLASRAAQEKFLADQLADDANGNLNVTSLMRKRSDIGQRVGKMAKGHQMETGTPDEGTLKRMYSDMTSDIDQSLTGEQASKWHDLNARERAFHNNARTLDKSLFGNRTLNATGNALLSPSLPTETVSAMQRGLLPDDFQQISGGIMRSLGRASNNAELPEGGASAIQVSKRLAPGNVQNAYTQSVQKKLFGDKADSIRAVADALAKVERHKNTSNTANSSAWMKIPQVLSGSVARPFTTATTLGLPYILSKATTSPRIINYLAKPQSKTSKYLTGKGARQFGKLSGVETGGLINKFRGIMGSDEEDNE